MRSILAWGLYDWANSAFATTVMAAFFPIFFKEYWSLGTDAITSTYRLGVANSTGCALVAFCAPILGAIADRGNAKKLFLFVFLVLGVSATGCLFLVPRGSWELAITLYILASIGFVGGNIFYDALLPTVASKERSDFVSSLGFALGYVGGGLLFLLNVLMVSSPASFGLNGKADAIRFSFLSVALWWGLFSLPLFIFVHERRISETRIGLSLVRGAFQQLAATFHKIRQLRIVFLFLLGYWCYIDGVDTIIRMAVDYGMSLGFASTSLMTALLITQFVGFPAALAFSRIAHRTGTKTAILIGLSIYLIVIAWGFLMNTETEFYLLAAIIGLVQGGVQALSRSFYSRIIPRNQAAEFFGFFNLLGKFAAILGPFLMGWIGVLSGSNRYAILCLLIFFLLGGILLYFVNEEEGARLAMHFEQENR